MKVGNFSPTVLKSQKNNKKWWNVKNSNGYNKYGYDGNHRDRAGYTKQQYLDSYNPYTNKYELYDSVKTEWTIDIIGNPCRMHSE